MRFLDRLLGRGGTPLAAVRWVVVDCETSGLDAARDRLLSVAAVALRGGRIDPADSWSAFVGQAAASAPENILIHGIGGDAQCAGRPAAEALREFADYIGASVPVAFNAPFDAAMLRREMARVAGLRAPSRWLDLAQLAPALEPARARTRRTLDDWLQEYDIEIQQRHDALADAFATAQLMLVLLAQARRQGAVTDADLLRLAGDSRWLQPV